MEHYQENPQLLDPVLQEIVAPLALALRRASSGQQLSSSSWSRSHYISQFIWVTASVRYRLALLTTSSFQLLQL